MNKIRLQVLDKYNIFLDNLIITSQAYNETERDVFNNSYSLSFNLNKNFTGVGELFNYIHSLKSEFKTTTFENCKIFVNDDLLTQFAKFELREVNANDYVCYLIFNEYKNILGIDENINNIQVNTADLSFNLNNYSGSTVSFAPTFDNYQAVKFKHILNGSFNYNGIDNYLTVNLEQSATEEDLIPIINMQALLRSFVNDINIRERSFESQYEKYVARVSNTEYNYNTTYAKDINVNATLGNYASTKFKYDPANPDNQFTYFAFNDDAGVTATYSRTTYITREDNPEYNYSYSQISNYDKESYDGTVNLLLQETTKTINLPIHSDTNIFGTTVSLSGLYNPIIKNETQLGSGIFFDGNNPDIYNSIIIPSYNDYKLQFSYNINISSIVHRFNKISDDYNLLTAHPLSQKRFDNNFNIALGFFNKDNTDDLNTIQKFIYGYDKVITAQSPTASFYEDIILDEYFDSTLLENFNGMIFFKGMLKVTDVSGTDTFDGFTILRFYTREFYDNNITELTTLKFKTPTGIDSPSVVGFRDTNNKYISATTVVNDSQLVFNYIHKKESTNKLLKPIVAIYDDSGYITPTTSNKGWEIASTGVIGQTSVYNKRYLFILNANNTSSINRALKMECFYNQANNVWKVPTDKLPDLSLSDLFKNICILQNKIIYYDNNKIDFIDIDDYFNLTNYTNFTLTKIENKVNITGLWITTYDSSNFYSKNIVSLVAEGQVKYESYFANSFTTNVIYRDGDDFTQNNILKFATSETYNKDRVEYGAGWSVTIDSSKPSYDNFIIFDYDGSSNTTGLTHSFNNKFNQSSDIELFSPNLYINNLYNFNFTGYNKRYEANINIPYHIWRHAKNRICKFTVDGINYLIFKIEQYNIKTESCKIYGLMS